jgi:predicted DNA-binding transcriptional regulator AlpA
MRDDQGPAAPAISPAYLRLRDAAAYCGLSAEMLSKLHAKGEGPPRIKKGRCVLYSIKALQEWMDRDQEETARWRFAP